MHRAPDDPAPQTSRQARAYSREAVADLVRLRDFIAQNDPGAARRIAADLITRIERLCEFPGMGRNVPQSPEPDTIRDFVFGKYVVRYAVHGDALVVLRPWHQHETRDGDSARK